MLQPNRLRAAALLLCLAACDHHAPPPRVAAQPACPGPYPIAHTTCELPPPTACEGICGHVVRAGSCAPLARVSVGGPGIPSATTNETGAFDLIGVPPGPHELSVHYQRDDGRYALDVVGGSQPLAVPLELTLRDRSCDCGGACPI